ncbi:short chain dehydrogenase/reductase [Burkholderia lata]|uniref:SDR family NAD(P)-dependent oxidoreductase n=1 Tax=Burkholderia lata (strain ATCC 17760 / DSM 23089 / LMG 22485 / NCIMB 9086 / R18194 / 383) TaxID=482957 RepID=UPI001452F699|nr:SDR family NAD(P)-dependent oxidoreductase [Burkholderia lata]VWB88109.1 short chain dehydrogenase/reductase [Burkholderia lata]
MKGLAGKHVVVTGGASGIGQATARRFVDEGAKVIILDRNRAALDATITATPDLVAAIPVDVSDDSAVSEAFAVIDRHLQQIDVLINNAGISVRHDSFRSITPAQWRQVIDTNLNGIFYVAREAVKRMQAGVILNMSSVNGLAAFPHYADYNASKAAVLALSQTMAVELAPAIRVNALCPGAVMTPMQQAEYTDEMFAAVNANIPLGRHADPAEIAAFFAFLASDEAAFITGHHYVIDGGELSRAAL